jgi:hypothetical protein
MSTYGKPKDHYDKVEDWMPSGAGYNLMHRWMDPDYMTGYHIVAKDANETNAIPMLYFIRTFYIGEIKPENMEISIDKTGWPKFEEEN